MAASELIASGTSYAASADIVLTAGTPVTLKIYFTGKDDGIAYDLQQKSSAGVYQNILRLHPGNIVKKGTLCGSGTYRVLRVPGANASSFEKD
jgi:hypothetical protein